jgi:integral membrane protein (TIGR01906 family)
MRRAPWPTAALFAASLAIIITLAGPLLLFNPWLTGTLQARHGVPAAFGTTQVEIDRVTSAILGDLLFGGSFDATLDGDEPLLDARERSHMQDVSRLVQLLAGVTVVAVVVGAVTGFLLRRERQRQGTIMVATAGAIGAAAVALALAFTVAFDTAFLAFHQVFFPPGTYLFEPGSRLITLFPEGFWFDAALIAGASIVLAALVVAIIGFLRWRSAPQTPPGP